MNDSKMSDSGSSREKQAKTRSYQLITKYFDKYFYKTDNFSLIKLMAYTPIGVTLVLIRCIILFLLNIILNIFPKLKNNSYFIQLICWSLGIFTQSNGSAKSESTRVYVSNHITCLDYLSIKSIISETNYREEDNMNRNLSTKHASNDKISTYFKQILQFEPTKIATEDLYTQSGSYPFIFFPELIGTNGQHGVLKFDAKPFGLNQENMQVGVVPVGIRAKRPVVAFSVNWLGSNDLINIFFMLFTPCTIYKVTFFPEQFLKDTETSEQFADRVQKIIATGLDLVCSNSDRDDIRQMWSDYEKYLHEQQERQEMERNLEQRYGRVNTEASFSDISRVASQVQNVMPHICYEMVREHMRITSSNDVDTILTSILDSSVGLVDSPDSSAQVTPVIVDTVPKKIVKGGFQTYESRKFNLLNEARKRYLAKNTK